MKIQLPPNGNPGIVPPWLQPTPAPKPNTPIVPPQPKE